jgi:GT2 family glycosyltransferase
VSQADPETTIAWADPTANRSVSLAAASGAAAVACDGRRGWVARDILLVLGTHRSGTSVLTECLSSAGFALPGDRSGPMPDNLRGHFEPMAVVRAHERLLLRAGSHWAHLAPLTGSDLSESDWCRAEADIIGALRTSYGRRRRIVVKDPRIAAAEPLWRRLAGRDDLGMRAVLALRDPYDVAASLGRRDGLSEDHALALWSVSVLSQLRLAEGMPASIVSFPEWAEAPETAFGPVAALLGLTDLQRQRLTGAARAAFDPRALHGGGLSGGRISPLGRIALDLHALVRAAAESRLAAMPAEAGRRDALDRPPANPAGLGDAPDGKPSRPGETARREGSSGLPVDPASRDAIARRLDRVIGLAARSGAAIGAQVRLALFGEQPTAWPESLAASEIWQRHRADQAATLDRRRELTRATGRARRLHTLLTRTEAQRDHLQASLTVCRAGADALAEQVGATEAQRDVLSCELARQRSDAAALIAQVAATEAQRDELAELLERARAGAEASDEVARAAIADRDAAQADRERAAREFAAHSADLSAAVTEARAESAAARSSAAEAAAALERIRGDLARMTELCRKERLTVLKPMYRNFYRLAGLALRRRLSDRVVERLKRLVPHPDGIPVPLAFGLPTGSDDHVLERLGDVVFQTSGTGDQEALGRGAGQDDTAALPASGPLSLPAPQGDKPDIFMFSIIDWTFRTQRPQHLARAFAARGHRVFYVEMEREPGPTRIGAVAPGVWAIRIATTPGGPVPTYTGRAGAEAQRFWLRAFEALRDRVGATPLCHAIIQHPYWWQFLRHAAPDIRITFDCMDEISGFSNTQPHVLAAERDLIARVDRMVVSSAWLAAKHGAKRPVTLIRNAADIAHFLPAAGDPGGVRDAAVVPGAVQRPAMSNADSQGADAIADAGRGIADAAVVGDDARRSPAPIMTNSTHASGNRVVADDAHAEPARGSGALSRVGAVLADVMAARHPPRRGVGAPSRPANASPALGVLPARDALPTADVLPADSGPEVLRVGYVGAIAEWFDTDLVEAVAQRLPGAEFHLCGAVTATAPLRLAALPNVTLHGEIPYANVPGFVAAMDVMTIPFRLDPIIRACDPVKFYEHSAAGRPTVATAIPELERAGDLVFRADDAAEFADAIGAAARAGRDAGYRARLIDYAWANTWTSRADAFLDAMTGGPKVSVIVLSYGDPELTLATLHSLVGRGTVWPDLEVIVVDNGSAPDALARIRDHAAHHPQVRLIENGANLGFAAGNNVGIAAATGDYVMFLNNDTFVAPGAISAMVSALERDPTLGVVGPLTNNIGNEARIAIEYADMDAMIRSARRIAEGHRGQITDVSVCAYFCAMVRRADLARVGPLSEDYGRGMFEDDDHCARFQAAGFRCGLAEDAFVHHHLSASFGALPGAERQALFARNRAIFEARWGAWQPHRYRTSRPPSTLTDPAGRGTAGAPALQGAA